MIYKNKKNNRIQDYQQINYIKNILETAAAKCQQAGMHDPTVYYATAQRIADTNSLNDPNKPRITFNTKQQKIKGQQEPVLELTATIGDETSTSYFLVKDSAAPGSKPTSEQLTYLRPDVVSARIQASLGLTPAAGASNPTNTQSIPHPTPVESTLATPSKAQILAQSMGQQAPTPLQTPTPPQPVASNPLADKLAENKGKVPEQLTAIDKLLQANLPIEDKLDAIEKTLDEMLKELTAMRVSLEATQAAVQAEEDRNSAGTGINGLASTQTQVWGN